MTESSKEKFDLLDVLAVLGVVFITAGLALVNIPLALFVCGVLLYVPATIGVLR